MDSLAVALFAAPALAQQEDVLIERGGNQALPPAANGIPPQVAEKLGLSKELVQRVQDLTFDANE